MRVPSLPLFIAIALLGLVPCSLHAQKAAKPNLLGENGGFEKSTVQDNLWDGVNSDGSLAGFTYSAQVVTERGSFSGLAMPPSVAFVDLTGSGKPDLITADPTGFFRYYPNSGTPGAPKFTNAEIMPIFVSTCNKPRRFDYDWNGDTDGMRFCPRLSLADWRHSGVLDLMVGNYLGEMLFLPNAGSARQPQYRWPGTVDKLHVQTNDQGRYWANLLSPVAYDWNGSGRLDLITGEGTYSANTVHLLLNIGDSGMPKFSSARDKHLYLAFGDGREQLIPTVVDYNGDGNPDLLVADRTGEVGVYLNPGKGKVTELKRTSTITFGDTSKLPGLCSIFAADYNGDGLFDLILGLPNGHIAVALNTGTKTEPKFGPPQDIKGVDRLGRTVRAPDGWAVNTWSIYGNALAYGTVVNNQLDPGCNPPEGANCLKMGYWPEAAKTFPMPTEGIPGSVRHITLSHPGVTLDVNKKYHFTFKTKGTGAENTRWNFHAKYHGNPTPVKVERDERGGAKNPGGKIDELLEYGQEFNPGTNWTPMEGDFTPRWKSQALAGEKTITFTLYVEFYPTGTASNLYVDDFVLTEVQ